MTEKDGRMESQIPPRYLRAGFLRGIKVIMIYAKLCCITQRLLKCSFRDHILFSFVIAGVCFRKALPHNATTDQGPSRNSILLFYICSGYSFVKTYFSLSVCSTYCISHGMRSKNVLFYYLERVERGEEGGVLFPPFPSPLFKLVISSSALQWGFAVLPQFVAW